MSSMTTTGTVRAPYSILDRTRSIVIGPDDFMRGRFGVWRNVSAAERTLETCLLVKVAVVAVICDGNGLWSGWPVAHPASLHHSG